MIKKIISIFKTIKRLLKNIFIRPFITVCAKIKYLLSGRQLVSAGSGIAKNLPKILKTKPEKREDYFDWGSIYIAKSLVLIITVIVIALPLLYIFLLHPRLIGWFGVKDFQLDNGKLTSYSGRVRVYYDEEFKLLEFEGRLRDGKADGGGSEYYENGICKFVGEFVDGMYEGEGILYYEDGSVEYRGEFMGGRFEGIGDYIDEDGAVYSGVFENGVITGHGTLTTNGNLYYEGNFSNGVIDGEGRTFYPNGTVRHSGIFSDGVPNGAAMEYYSDGTIKYNGTFVAGKYSGSGVLYFPNGTKQYSGGFDMGVYSGSGTLFGSEGERLYTGEFEEGLYSGNGTLYGFDGSITSGTFSLGVITGVASRTFADGVRYDGCFSDNMMNGSGTLSDVTGNFTYSGMFLDDDFDYSNIIGANSSSVKAAMPSLLQTVAEDCFYLNDSSFGIAVRCSFASNGDLAAAVEMFERPISGAKTVISQESDIFAPHASSITRSEDEYLPLWAANEFGISAESVNCYTALYGSIAVNFWTDKATGRLLLKSAKSASDVPSASAENTSENNGIFGLSSDEVSKLLEELGLDIADFASLWPAI